MQVRLKGHALSATFASLTDARDWATKIESGIQRQHAAAGAVTLGELLERYRHEILPRKEVRTQSNQGQHLTWWKRTLGLRPLPEVTPDRLAACRDELAKTRSAGTVNQYMRTLSNAFTIASREWGWLEASPLSRVQPLPEPRGRVRFLDDNERPRLLAACQASGNRMLYPVVVLALATGARKMELLSLTWPQLDM